MPILEDRPARRRPGEPTQPVPLPLELADFLKAQDFVALWHAADLGTLLLVKAPTVEVESLGGTYPIGLEHQLFDHPASPVIRSLVSFHDRPAAPLRLETFTNIGDPDQRAHFTALGAQPEIPILVYDEALRHRRSKRVRNSTAGQIPTIVAAAERLLAPIPAERVDFVRAKAAVMEVTTL